jgi:hypothetical protein
MGAQADACAGNRYTPGNKGRVLAKWFLYTPGGARIESGEQV